MREPSTFVNQALVRDGFARAALYEPNDRYIDLMYRAEGSARAADRGLSVRVLATSLDHHYLRRG